MCHHPERCHGWSVVSCAGPNCGLVAPCARQDCPSCGEHPEILQEAIERRERKIKWVAKEGLDCRLPMLVRVYNAT